MRPSLAGMSSGARTPEELESLLEDAFVVGDGDALVELFEGAAVLVADQREYEARGCDEIARLVCGMCERGYSYLADPREVVQAGDTTLVIGERAVNVMRRGPDRRWRYAISLLNVDTTTEGTKR